MKRPFKSIAIWALSLYFSVLINMASADEAVAELQTFLNSRYCHAGTADGAWGKKTDAAVEQFEQASGLEIVRPFTADQFSKLESSEAFCQITVLPNASAAERFALEKHNSVRGPRKLAGGVQEFYLLPGECKAGKKVKSSVASLGSKTNDCDRKRQRTEMITTSKVGHGARRIYQWEIFVPKDFRSTATDDHLIVGQFTSGGRPTSTFSLSQDSGYFINGRTCFGPEDFGKWNSVMIRVFWHSQRKNNLKDRTPGVFEVWCDGKLIWDRSGRPNVAKGESVSFKYGLYHAANFPKEDNVTVKFRNVKITSW